MPPFDIEAQNRRSRDPKDAVRFQSTIFVSPAQNPASKSYQPPFRKLGNPGPLGLSAFALTTMVLSLVNVQARSVTNPHIAIGLAFAYGGLAQFVAGIWEFVCGNTFGALAFTSYGGFWMSFGVIFVPFFNISAAYQSNIPEFFQAIGHYLICWFVFTTILMVGTIRSSVAFCGLFVTVSITFLTLAIGYYRNSDETCIKLGGYMGLVGSVFAFYNAFAAVWNVDNSFFHLPVGEFPWAEKAHMHVGPRF